MAFSFQFRDHIDQIQGYIIIMEFQDLFLVEVATMTLTKEGKW